MIINKQLRYLLLFAFCLSLVGCDINSPIQQAPLSNFSLTPLSYSNSNIRAMTNKTLLITSVVASPGYDTNKMIYVNVPYKLKPYANNAWVAPPATMLQPIVANAVRRTHYFKAVVMAPYVGVSRYILDVRLLVLQQEFLQPISQERLVVQVTLVDSLNTKLLGDRLFEITVPSPQNNPYSGVLAANKSAHVLSARVARYVVSLVRRRS
jgi:cholesterol transport system auxiliary component